MTVHARIERAPSPRTTSSRRPADRGERLARTLVAHAARAGCAVRLTVAMVEPWCSATFSGSVIVLTLDAMPGPALTRWLAALPEAEISLGRDLIADIAVETEPRGLRVLLCLDAANG
ncbi:hypothetical protein ACR720_03180 [Sphingomonas parapaucimobilis]|jgi:hypothetical protein|uniref:hypothetical protein n=1 Tax=Sphingomonas parapaucimobilis TaxID=28213 RepID=UPI0039E7D47E